MTAMMKAIHSAVFWQVAAGFVLGTLGTLAAHSANAERQPVYKGAAHHWRIDR